MRGSPDGQSRVVIIAMAINQPRVQRRILAIDQAGFDVTVYAFDRKIYDNSSSLVGSRAKIQLIGSMAGGVAVGNLLSLLFGLTKVVLSEARRPKQFLYFFGFPTILVSKCLGKAYRIYEISDLRFSSWDTGLSKSIQLKLENRFLRIANAIVLTSAGFLRELEPRVPSLRGKAIVIENGIPEELMEYWRRPHSPSGVSSSRIRIGFIGHVRYIPILSEFVKAVGERSTDYELHIYGNGYNLQSFIELCDQFDNVVFHGKFENPEDVPRLYRHIDVGLAVYDNSDRNVQLALPNKLYESVYFGVPLIVSYGTSLWDRVSRWGVGYGVDPLVEGFAERLLDSLSVSDIKNKQEACAQVSNEFLGAQIERLIECMTAESEKYETNSPKT